MSIAFANNISLLQPKNNINKTYTHVNKKLYFIISHQIQFKKAINIKIQTSKTRQKVKKNCFCINVDTYQQSTQNR